MKQQHAHTGSMVLTCVFFISVFMLIMLVQWRSQEALQGIVILRAQYIQKQYAAQALLEYGIELGKKQYGLLAETVAKQKIPLIITFNRWPLGNENYAQGTIEISFNKNILITAMLTQDKVPQISFSCCLEKQTIQFKDVYSITAWKKNEIRQKK